MCKNKRVILIHLVYYRSVNIVSPFHFVISLFFNLVTSYPDAEGLKPHPSRLAPPF